MNIVINKKLKNLLQNWPPGFVATASWFNKFSISEQLRQRYLKSQWIESLGYGAYMKAKDKISWYGAFAGIQNDLKNKLHIGGATALSIYGTTHYVRTNQEIIYLFSKPGQKLPLWFSKYNWETKIKFVKTSFLKDELGIKEVDYKGFLLNISNRERAILECIYLSPENFDIVECYQLLENLNTLRPNLVQEFLEQCQSIKTKRLFLYMAQKANLPVYKHINFSKLNLGSGDRSLVNGGGVYNSEFKLVLPKELVEYV